MTDCTIIILGATGDLTKRKLVPALYRLIQDKKVNKLLVVGSALDQVSADEFIERGRPFIENINMSVWKKLKEAAYYKQIDFNDAKGFNNLKLFVESLEKEHGVKSNRLVYLAVPSLFFCKITKQLGISGLVKKADENGLVGESWQRIVYEKPFGISLASAVEINACITNHFNEKQIYRIDHYLTKELVGSILLSRFTNMIFEPLWNSNYIEEVHIVLSETLGIEFRGEYYDQYGVLKDMVQNHILQLVTLVAMELPKELIARCIRDQKAAVLQKIRCIDGLFGQYDGYTNEKGISKKSSTPTFAELLFNVDTPRWQGVPFRVKTGKALNRKDTSIHIIFKEVPCTIRDRCFYSSNALTIRIAPDASFSLQLNTKKPGATYEVTPVNLFFSHNYVFGAGTPEAYEIILEQVINGEQSVSVRFDEIEYSWSIIESIEKMDLPMYHYKKGSEGPKEIEQFEQQHTLRWRL